MISRFFRKPEAEPALPDENGPLGLILGGAVEIDTLSLQADMTGAEPAMGLPQGGTFIVAAWGEAKLDADTVLTRYYDEDDRILQVLAAPGTGEEGVEDVSLYAPWDSVSPVGREAWNEWTGPDGLIGQPGYDADGIHFERFWGDGPGRAALVEFTEDVHSAGNKRLIHQRCMLYARAVGRAQEMLLINIERDLDERARRGGESIEFLIGYGLSPADIRKV